MKKLLAVGLIAVLLGLPGVNIYHHVELPSLNKWRISSHEEVNFTYPFIHKYTDIQLETVIHDAMWYRDVAKSLRDANYGDVVTFHLVGYGGEVETVEMIVNEIHTSKAYVIMSVEAPVYSGHAYLALFGDKLVMTPYSYLMLHDSTILNVDCYKATGTDRGVSNVEHCQSFKDMEVYTTHKLLDDMPVVTSVEKVRLKEGHDVYLSAEEVMSRYNDHTGAKQ